MCVGGGSMYVYMFVYSVHVCVCLPPQDGSNDSACQLLKNLCSLKVFLESSLACLDVPDVYYTEPGDLLLTQNVITSQFVTRASSLVCVAWSTQSTIHTCTCCVRHMYVDIKFAYKRQGVGIELLVQCYCATEDVCMV